MKLAEIHFDWCPSIAGADSRGENLLFPLKTQSVFRAVDGWSIERLPSGEFRLHREGMPAPVVVGDGYTYVEAASGSLNGEAADGQAPGTSADAGSKPAPTTKRRAKP